MTSARHLDQRLKTQHLRVGDAIAEHGSLLKASAALHLSQPALSKTLREAEDILGVKLFERHARGARPTLAGAAFVESARRVLAEWRRLDETLDLAATSGARLLALGVLPVAASGVLPGVLARLRERESGLRIRLEQGRTDELLPLLAAGEIDLVVGRLYEPASPDAFEREALWSEPMSILARAEHPIFREERLEAAHLRAFDLVLPTLTQKMGHEIDHILRQLGLAPASAYRSSSAAFIREMVFAGDYLAILPRLMMVGDLLRGGLRVAPLPIPSPERPAGLIRRAGQTLPAAAELFIGVLRGYVAEVEGLGVR